MVIFYLSLYLALAIRAGFFSSASFWEHFWPFSTILFFWLLIFYSFNLYDISFQRNSLDFLSNTIKALIINTAISAIFFYVVQQLIIAPKTILILHALSFFVIFGIFRYLANYFFGLKFKKNVLCVGAVGQFADVASELETKPQLGYIIKAVIDSDFNHKRHASVSETLAGIYSVNILSAYSDIQNVISSEKINTIIVEPVLYDSRDLIQKLYECLPLRVEIVSLATFSEKTLKKIPLGSTSQTWLLENIASGKNPLYEFLKKISDVILSLLGILVLGILFPCVAIAIKLEDGGPIFYKQERVGKNGKLFDIIKFRTMIVNAEKGGAICAGDNDPRITKTGRILRRLRLDEFTQVLNILQGDMSIVGPRAERPIFHHQFCKEIPFYKERTLLKPGLTGWAQVNYLYAATLEENSRKLQYDLYYLKNKSFILDLSIIFKTISIVLRGGGK